tara:strand:- start:288 stop:557 length:270 start_codon:yes stop_codon:yes gene_type:complete
MDPEIMLSDILELLNDMSNDPDDVNYIKHNNWFVEEIVTHVENYEQWLRKGGFKPDFQNVVENWLTEKQNDAKNSPDKRQQQFWYGADL